MMLQQNTQIIQPVEYLVPISAYIDSGIECNEIAEIKVDVSAAAKRSESLVDGKLVIFGAHSKNGNDFVLEIREHLLMFSYGIEAAIVIPVYALKDTVFTYNRYYSKISISGFVNPVDIPEDNYGTLLFSAINTYQGVSDKTQTPIVRTIITDVKGDEYDFIPVRIGQDGYMYEKNEGDLLSSPTGIFTLGADTDWPE